MFIARPLHHLLLTKHPRVSCTPFQTKAFPVPPRAHSKQFSAQSQSEPPEHGSGWRADWMHGAAVRVNFQGLYALPDISALNNKIKGGPRVSLKPSAPTTLRPCLFRCAPGPASAPSLAPCRRWARRGPPLRHLCALEWLGLGLALGAVRVRGRQGEHGVSLVLVHQWRRGRLLLTTDY